MPRDPRGGYPSSDKPVGQLPKVPTGPAPGARPPHHELADVHAYVVPITPKMLGETLAVTEYALQELGRQRPGYNAGGTVDTHLARLRLLMDECKRMRPTGPDGKHGNRHTPVCGCADDPLSTRH